MKCPKCGVEIPFYNLKANCKECGVNIMYYTHEEDLIRDAKRSELEGGSARMVIARVKAEFIGSKLAIARMVLIILSAAALLVPFFGVRYTAPFFEESLSLGIIGLVQAFTDGLGLNVLHLLQSEIFHPQTLSVMIAAGFFAAAALIDVILLVALIIGFIRLTKTARFIGCASIVGAGLSLIAQITVFILNARVADSSVAITQLGFGALAAMAVFFAVFFVNRAMLKKGIEPVYRENDIKRKEMLKKVHKGEVNLDDLPLPVFESEEEREERMKALEEALKAEEEGKEL